MPHGTNVRGLKAHGTRPAKRILGRTQGLEASGPLAASRRPAPPAASPARPISAARQAESATSCGRTAPSAVIRSPAVVGALLPSGVSSISTGPTTLSMSP